ncbi:NAD(P)-dependent dehydrogenase, short-chain alcohol dehydrogenase family [Tistlia consotensis]|uniref:NAD(P)-dependent dehydrogenase, short-chain alcohol dehydrogenase family n=1 Tax=Tistlia consotensis USBA 355 TaxID=560819 RepID=A0A1Y6CYV4_9PROT|nr:SDR family oxidoreductase [Tistlia consotensis]SMF83745.1 NAD(P)-dependent dehydrogenase, short-chain alcohol dehydrogenase family [Tistlia consotensis USBA 355]SNS34225.1 NAD(P)-dependent dehydrogenase, short-chain alcohol dehydrogenase family [Tistlia consotensis]
MTAAAVEDDPRDPRGILLVTGGSRGIGAAVCRLAALEGYDLAVGYAGRREAAEAVAAAVRAAGRRAVTLPADVADPAAVAGLFDAAEAALGPLTALVNSAGITGLSRRFLESDPEEMRRVVEVNTTGTLYCCREAARRMARSRGGRGGTIVNLSSAAATLGSPGEFVWYAASKGGVDSLTIGLSKELGPEGIRVNAVSPGLIETEIHASAGDAGRLQRYAAQVPLGRSGTAEEVAEPIVWLLSDAASYVSGAILRVGGGR